MNQITSTRLHKNRIRIRLYGALKIHGYLIVQSFDFESLIDLRHCIGARCPKPGDKDIIIVDTLLQWNEGMT